MEINATFQLAYDLINYTGQHVFLSGKAGTGKTTFLKYLVQHSQKKLVVMAPTGVAAINAGGVTMHSFLTLPFSPFIPANKKGFDNTPIEDKNSLLRNLRFNKTKIDLLKELELIIIDEVSMVRADMLDAADLILRHVRRNHREAFGGIQVLYIGDLFQLPPVIKEDEWQLIREHYEGPFFFQSKVVQETQPTKIELTKIYRQKNSDFISLLNSIRHNNILPNELITLNKKHKPNYQAQENEITLCTHNAGADRINIQKLNAINEKEKTYKANIKGEFNSNNVLADEELRLKIGAQIMFLKNDTEGKFYNGKIGRVLKLSDDEIEVESNDETITVKRDTWKNIRYQLDAVSNEINEKIQGEFEQFPIKLAWAITIHKSQGLTFERVCIDAGNSFSSGQVYVALSRCTNLEGISLLSSITNESIINDNRIVDYCNSIANDTELQKIIEEKKNEYLYKQLERKFVWQKNIYAMMNFIQSIPEKEIPDKPTVLLFFEELKNRLEKLQTVSDKFIAQLTALYKQSVETNNTKPLTDRATKAIEYFIEEISKNIVTPLLDHFKKIKKEKRVKGYTKDLSKQIENLTSIVNNLENAHYGEVKLYTQKDTLYEERKSLIKKEIAEKRNTVQITYDLFMEHKSIDFVAKIRNLTLGTVEGHLTQLISDNKISIYDFMKKEKVNKILETIIKHKNPSLSEIKNKLGDNYSFSNIKAVIAHNEIMKKHA